MSILAKWADNTQNTFTATRNPGVFPDRQIQQWLQDSQKRKPESEER